MDIPALSTVLASSRTSTDISIAVLSMGLDAVRTEGDAIAKMLDQSSVSAMERSIRPHLGGNIDVSV